MLTKRDYDKISFKGVGLAFIIFGSFLTAFGFVGWLINVYGGLTMSYPFFKAIMGIIVIGVGYLILELELLRKK